MEKKQSLFNKIELNISSILLLVMLVLLSLQVIGRFVFKYSNSWSEELARYMFVWFVYLTASYAVYKQAHIKIDGTMNMFPEKIRKYIALIGDLIFLIYCILLAYYSAKYTIAINLSGQVSLGLGIKMSYVYASIPICHSFMAIRLIINIIQNRKTAKE